MIRPKWQRVEDGLPTEEGEYLVAVAWKGREGLVRQVAASNFLLAERGRRYWLSADRHTDRWTCWEKESRDFGWRVTHWAVLPEGPEEEDKMDGFTEMVKASIAQFFPQYGKVLTDSLTGMEKNTYEMEVCLGMTATAAPATKSMYERSMNLHMRLAAITGRIGQLRLGEGG